MKLLNFKYIKQKRLFLSQQHKDNKLKFCKKQLYKTEKLNNLKKWTTNTLISDESIFYLHSDCRYLYWKRNKRNLKIIMLIYINIIIIWLFVECI